LPLWIVAIICAIVGVGLYLVSNYFGGRSYHWNDEGNASKSAMFQNISNGFKWLIGLDVLVFLVFVFKGLS
jgi:hypothetical protein